jgi:hypothetical protein
VRVVQLGRYLADVLAAFMEPVTTTRAPLLESAEGSEDRKRPSESDAAAKSDAAAHVHTAAQLSRPIATATYIAAVTICYFIAATFVSPQIIQADRPPWGLKEQGYYSYTYPTRDGGGYCYYPPCNSFNGVYKPPWFYNPTQSGHGQLSAGIAAKHQVYVFSFYLFLLLPGLCAALKLALGGGSILDRTLPAKLGASTRLGAPLTASSCMLWFSILVLVGVWLWQAYEDYLRPVYKDSDPTSHEIRKAWGLVFAQLNNLLVGLILLPISKFSLIAVMFGTGWEKTLGYHRLLGKLFLLSIFAHAGLMMSKWLVDPYANPPYKPGDPPTWTPFFRNILAYSYYQWGAVIWGWALQTMIYMLIGLLCVSVTALPPIRRRFYWLFYRVRSTSMHGPSPGPSGLSMRPATFQVTHLPSLVSQIHVIVLPIFVLATLAHSWTAWQYALVGLLLYALDKALQLVQTLSQLHGAQAVRTVRFEAIGQSTVALTCEQPNLKPRPGQVVYLYCRSVSRWWPEFHPFTVVEDFATMGQNPDAEKRAGAPWRHYIGASKKGRWTDRLLRLANDLPSAPSMLLNNAAADIEQQPAASEMPRLYMLGPFGPDRPIADVNDERDPRAVLLVAAGTGITPIAALLQEHLRRRRARRAASSLREPPLCLAWTARDLELFAEFAPLLDLLSEGNLSFSNGSVQLFYTGNEDILTKPAVATAPWRPTIGRPNFEAVIARTRDAAACPVLTAVRGRVEVHVHCCGPQSVSDAVRKACYTPIGEAVHYHAESFEL